MFELDNEIQRWKSAFTNNGAVSCEQILEMESHLRDQIDALQSHGLSSQEAFTVARMRIGEVSEIECEFAKIQPKRKYQFRAIWMLAGYLFFTLVGSLVALTGTGTSAGLGLLGVSAVPTAAVVALIQTGLWLTAFAALYKLWPIERLSQTRPNLTVTVWLLGVLLLLPLVTVCFKVLQTSVAEPVWVGELFTWLAVYGLAIKILVCGACLLAIHMLVRSYTTPERATT